MSETVGWKNSLMHRRVVRLTNRARGVASRLGSALRVTMGLPSRCFISHAYADADLVTRLLAAIPPHVTPHVFPPITVPPHEAVSTPLVQSLLNCEALLYIDGLASARSFWVAFERDFAKRAGKAVYRVNPDTLKMTLDKTPASALHVYASYHHRDRNTVRDFVRYMSEERHFQCFLDTALDSRDSLEAVIEAELSRHADLGYIVVFWSASAATSDWVAREIEHAARTTRGLNDRLLFACLDATPVPAFWMQYHEPAVQLFSDADRSQKQRVDDLIVRLYWLIHRKTTELK